MKTSIVILTFNQLHYTKLCIDSIRKYTDKETYEIIVVDNHSTDGTVEWLKVQGDIQTIFNVENLGFPIGCNQGLAMAQGDNILLLNNDVIVTPHWLSNLTVCLYSSERIGAVGAVSNSCSNYQTIPITYKNIEEMIPFAEKNNILNKGHWEERPRLIGFCLLIKKDVVDKIGLLDERFSPGNFEDDDYCYRIRQAGYQLMLCKDVFIHHFGSASFSKSRQTFNDILTINRKKFMEKWGFDAWSPDFIRQDFNYPIENPPSSKTNISRENISPSAEVKVKSPIDPQKICFISIVNDEEIYGKALAHIRQLTIPDGYQVDILCIKNASSMTSGYNHGINHSNAKYKVYLHQDVYILNKNFIADFLNLFKKHPNIGLMGVAGSKTIPSNGIWWESSHRYGKVYDSHTGQMMLLRFADVENEYEAVTAIDGLLMITQYDIPWREDIFDGWHFYDISQSIEFQKKGYDVVIPNQKGAWCIHDCDVVNTQNGYEKYRKRFLDYYEKKLFSSHDKSPITLTEKQRVCFSCLTPYHVFVSYILSKTVYKDHHKTILFSDHYLNKLSLRSLDLNIWDKVHLIEEKNKPHHFIQQQLHQIENKNIDILHYFSWGSILNCIILNYFADHTKVILTDEGVMTYSIKEFYQNWKTVNKIQYDPIDFNRISEIWLFDTQLYISELNKSLKNIEFMSYLNNDLASEICHELNILFDYKHETRDWDILFFDQPLSLAHILSNAEEKSLLEGILQATKDLKLCIKKHPTDNEGKYAGLDMNFLQGANIPWEIVYLNEYVKNKAQIEKKIYMTYSSAAMLNTRILFKDLHRNSHFIALNKLFKNVSNEFSEDNTLESFYQKFKCLYSDNFYEIESFEKLNHLLIRLSQINDQ
ncbi:glycosyltransferase [Anaerosolibacter sp.]|uniref:glycosyltransferase n=1 Tax=Anaerosolibacter sp. TaxID=1872527 RepID=UPI0039EE680A